MAVLWSGVKMLADHPDRDGSRRPVSAATDGVDPFPFVCARKT